MKSNNRYLGALMIAPFIIFIFLGGIPLKLFVLTLTLVGMYEFYEALREKDFKPVSLIGYLVVLVYYLFNTDFKILMSILIIATLIVLAIPVFKQKITFIDSSLTLLGILYVGIFLSFIPLVESKVNGQFYVWLIFIGSWVTDSAAFYAGKFFGKNKLCPEVSPKKTIEGSIGGLIGATIGSGLFGLVVGNFTNVIPVYHFILIGALCGVISQLGDLVASSIKRYVGVKDYSNLIPGHGGILDRFDSTLFSGLVVFYYLTFIINI